MKNIKLYINLLFVILAFSSCDEYLDVKPVDKVIPKTLQEFRGLITSAYGSVPAEVSKLSFRTDEVKFNESAWQQNIANYKDIFLWKDEAPEKGTSPFNYLNFYRTIFYANHIIKEGVKATEGSQKEIDQLVGEAYLLRALMHFNLVNQYAVPYNKATADKDRGIPISTAINLEANYAPSTVAEVYKQVEEDIKSSLKLLNVESFEVGKNYRATKPAAYALQARVALYKKEWDNAFSAAQKVLEIKSDLEDLNKDDAVIPNKFTSKENIMTLEEGLKSSALSTIFVSDKLLALYEKDNDLRMSKYYSKKGDKYVVSKGGNESFKCTFRTSEMLLISAEAKANLGELKDARTFMNQLKVKRLKKDFYTAEVTRLKGLNQAKLIEEVAKERMRELSFEGHRWFDLRRTTQEEIVHTYKKEKVTLIKNDPRYTIRFPQEAVVNNPNLRN